MCSHCCWNVRKNEINLGFMFSYAHSYIRVVCRYTSEVALKHSLSWFWVSKLFEFLLGVPEKGRRGARPTKLGHTLSRLHLHHTILYHNVILIYLSLPLPPWNVNAQLLNKWMNIDMGSFCKNFYLLQLFFFRFFCLFVF